MKTDAATFLDRVDVLILTKNEAVNLARTLEALRDFPRVIVLDSESTDATVEIAQRYANVRVCMRRFDNHAAQWNYGLTHCELAAEWVLALDADYLLTASLLAEMARLEPPPSVHGYRSRFHYCIEGKPLSSSLYPPVTVLYRRSSATYVQDGHTQRVMLSGIVHALQGYLLHDDRKPFSCWLAAQDRYARLECDFLMSTPWRRLRWRDRLRRMTIITPWLVPLYCLTARRGFLDGRHGLLYALQRGIAEAILSARLLQAGLSGRETP